MYTATIYQRNGYSLDSMGNGWAYQLEHEASGTTVWLQDEDATEFRAEFDACDNIPDPDRCARCMRDLFDRYLEAVAG